MQARSKHGSRYETLGQVRFGLPALLEYVTLCAILLGLSSPLGFRVVACLIFMCLALAARQGVAALMMLMIASVVAEWPPDPLRAPQLGRQLLLFVTAGLLANWYRLRPDFRAFLRSVFRFPSAGYAIWRAADVPPAASYMAWCRFQDSRHDRFTEP